MMERCPFAVSTDEYHGFECMLTEGECVYLFPTADCEFIEDGKENEDA